MKPFNLERALAGDAVITRDGREVTQLVKFDVESKYKLFGVVSKNTCSWILEGKHINYYQQESKYDLFMNPTTVKVEGWINVYVDGYHSKFYSSKEIAEKNSIVEKPHKTIFISEEIEVE